MGKIRNIKYQFRNVIDQHFREGMNKHSLKRNHEMKGNKIFSYSDRKNLIDLSSNFSNYMKEHHPEVKMVRDITSEHIQEFINSKSEECSQKTLEQYQSRFRKLETLVTETYKTEVNYHNVTVPLSHKNGGGKIRDFMMSDADYHKMLNTTNDNLRKGLVLSKEFGLRCSEISKLRYSDIKSDGINIVDSKGKRSRFVPVENEKQRDVIKQFRQGQQGRVCPIQSESLQQAFNREKKRQGICDGNGAFHTLRKNFATSKYQEYRSQGLPIQKSLDKVSEVLGHGSNRNDLMKQYICSPID